MKFLIKDFFSMRNQIQIYWRILNGMFYFFAVLLHIFQLYMIFQDLGKAVYGAVV